MRKALIILSCIAALTTTACTGDSNRPVATGEGTIRALNTIPTSPVFSFLIEERTAGTTSYGNVSSQLPFDDLEYTFNFQVILPDQVLPQRVASSTVKIEKDREYTFVVTGDIAAPDIIVWEDAAREWDPSETVFQARFAHTAESVGPIDVYFATPGTPPVAGQAVGTLSFGELLPPTDYAAGDYEYIVTTAGNPGDVLFSSAPVSGLATTGFILSIFDSTASNPGPLLVRRITDGGIASSVGDANVPSTIQFIHAAASLATSDIYTDALLTDQIVANHAYRDVTPDLEIETNLYTMRYTPAGSTGSILLEGNATIFPATHNQYYVVGEPTDYETILRVVDRRSVETQVKLTFTHAALNHPLIDVYIVEAGTDIEDVLLPDLRGLTAGALPQSLTIPEGDLEIYVTVATEKTVIEGPVALTTALGDVLEYITFDNVDPATLDLVAIPLP